MSIEDQIDYSATGELFCARSLWQRSRLTYKRFDTAAEAIQFAMEQLTPEVLRATTLEVSEVRLRGDEIGRAYASRRFPLPRKAGAGKPATAGRKVPA